MIKGTYLDYVIQLSGKHNVFVKIKALSLNPTDTITVLKLLVNRDIIRESILIWNYRRKQLEFFPVDTLCLINILKYCKDNLIRKPVKGSPNMFP